MHEVKKRITHTTLRKKENPFPGSKGKKQNLEIFPRNFHIIIEGKVLFKHLTLWKICVSLLQLTRLEKDYFVYFKSPREFI